MAENLKPIVKFEPLPARITQLIYQHGMFIIQGKIDEEFGAGKIDNYTKAVWTTDGKRIEVFLKDAFIISQTREADPLYAEKKKEQS